MRRLKKELWPYSINLNVDDTRMKIDDVELWLGESIGGFKVKWNAVYLYNSTDYYFKTGEDAMLFKLRWA